MHTPEREVRAHGTTFGVKVGEDGEQVQVTQGVVTTGVADEAAIGAGQRFSSGEVGAAPRASHALQQPCHCIDIP